MEIECARCDTVHRIDSALAARAAGDFVRSLTSKGSSAGFPRLPVQFDALMEVGGGKMFGCLVAEDDEGETQLFYAFSGMLAGRWSWPGWAEPCFDVSVWRDLEARYDPGIAALTVAIEGAPAKSSERKRLLAERAQASRKLMERYHDLYFLRGPAGRRFSLGEALGKKNPMSGMGDCCAPKLLNAARGRGWRVHSLVEFFIGTSRRPGGREHGQTYEPCEDKCGPLLPVLLCPRFGEES